VAALDQGQLPCCQGGWRGLQRALVARLLGQRAHASLAAWPAWQGRPGRRACTPACTHPLAHARAHVPPGRRSSWPPTGRTRLTPRCCGRGGWTARLSSPRPTGGRSGSSSRCAPGLVPGGWALCLGGGPCAWGVGLVLGACSWARQAMSARLTRASLLECAKQCRRLR